jgi:hypothetical protein
MYVYGQHCDCKESVAVFSVQVWISTDGRYTMTCIGMSHSNVQIGLPHATCHGYSLISLAAYMLLLDYKLLLFFQYGPIVNKSLSFCHWIQKLDLDLLISIN